MAGAQLSQLAMTTTDVAFVGRLPGNGLASMAVGYAAYGIFLSFGIGLIAAVNPMVSQAHGAGKKPNTSSALAVGLLGAVLYGLVAQLCLFQVDKLYLLLGYSPSVTAVATSFVRALMLGLPAFLSFLAIKNYLDSTSRPKAAFVIAFAAIGLNGVLDYALVWGGLGLPAVGVTGAGAATSVVNVVMAFALYGVVRGELPAGFLRVDTKTLKEFLALGLPVGGSLLMEIGLFALCALLMGALGPEEAAAHQIVITCASATFMVPLGISFAGATRVGQAIGAHEWHRVRSAGLAAIAVGVTAMVISGTLFLALPQMFVDLLWNSEGETKVKDLAVQLLAIAAVFQVFDGLQVTTSGALRGMKDVKFPMAVCFACYWIVGVTVAVGMGFHTGLRHLGVWFGLLSGLALAGTILFLRFWQISGRVGKQDESTP